MAKEGVPLRLEGEWLPDGLSEAVDVMDMEAVPLGDGGAGETDLLDVLLIDVELELVADRVRVAVWVREDSREVVEARDVTEMEEEREREGEMEMEVL